AVIGVARKELSSDAFRGSLEKSLHEFGMGRIDSAIARRLLACVSYVEGDAETAATYQRLRDALERIEAERETRGNRLFYLATPPTAFAPIACRLGASGLTREANGAWRRVIVEKPFGTDLASARALNQTLLEVLAEHQIYRIDHYLGKETVQNILVVRFANGLFEPI